MTQTQTQQKARKCVHEATSAGPRWLDAREQAAWQGAVVLLLKVPTALDAQLTKSAGMTMYEYLVLARLSEQPARRIRTSALAALTNGSLSRLSHVADRLERRGLLYRERDPEDRRFMMAALTPAGFDAVVAAAPGHVAAVRDLVLDGLTPDQLQTLEKVGAHILAR